MSQESKQGEDIYLNQIRFEYAWRFFELHARQRIMVFNFFLLGSGVLANAYGLLLREGLHLHAGAVSAVGLLVCIISFALDVRNHQLVLLGEDALIRIERDFLLLPSQVVSNRNSPEYLILTREREQSQTSFWFKHKTLIRSLEAVVACGFFLAALQSVSNGLGS